MRTTCYVCGGKDLGICSTCNSTGFAPPARKWEVSHGYYCDRVDYRGPSTFLAGLHYARANRDHNHSTSTTDVVDLESADGEYDSEGRACSGDSRTEEEADFFNGCAAIGRSRRNKRRAS